MVFVNILHDQRGSVHLMLLPMYLVMVLSLFSMVAVSAFAAKKNAVTVYQWLDAVMDFTAQAITYNRAGEDYESRTPEAQQWFVYAFSRMVDADFDGSNFTPHGSFPPGPVRLVSFGYAPPGTPVPGSSGQATTAGPGYQAELEVPVLKANLPFIGLQYVTVPMRVVGVVKPLAER
ncbi:hypothetical protein [Desulfofundulus luciae]|uniref:hypothetical protein n=1 Tax=Desulfofundulus luciae TaxID=74702 RepID=UPI0027D8A465|nr:hypothetical protein [Desulfofundulus luciae]